MRTPSLTNRLVRMPLFGYGSLVNADTLHRADVAVLEARLSGWERVWSHRIPNSDALAEEPRYPLALSIQQRVGTTIWGVALCGLSMQEAAALRSRELFYEILEVDLEVRSAPDDPWRSLQAYTYVSPPDWKEAADIATGARYEIWRSYVHVVLKGFMDFYKEPGLSHFISTTSGWAQPYLEDDPPRYPRRALVDIGPVDQANFDAWVRFAIERDRGATGYSCV
ncbi:MAG: gamma-glutamylcyclotransferase family protein [Pseudomonadota bacterium]